MKIALIGKSLTHSFSPSIHQAFGRYAYTLCPLPDEEAVKDYLKEGDFDALNVTIPYKQTVLPLLDVIAPDAMAIGAVNTIVKKDGKLYGYNTDSYGLAFLLKEAKISLSGKKVLILGSGGTSLTAKATALAQGVASVHVVSRRTYPTYDDLEAFSDTEILINTTPVGMYPNNDEIPLSLDLFPNLCGVVDVIYNPLSTHLVTEAKDKGIPAVNGLLMLVAQAAKACSLFCGEEVPNDTIKKVYHDLARKEGNIFLIGMPGVGKSTVGKVLAELTGKTFVDTDTLFFETYHVSPADFIKEHGEPSFRQKEHALLCKAGSQKGQVVATGGGVVTLDENYYKLKQNGRIFFLERKLEDLVTGGRPLSEEHGVQNLYRARLPRYLSFADSVIALKSASQYTKELDTIILETAHKILEDYHEHFNA